MADALNATGVPIFFSYEPHLTLPIEWTKFVGNAWRTGGDINSHFSSVFTDLAVANPWATVRAWWWWWWWWWVEVVAGRWWWWWWLVVDGSSGGGGGGGGGGGSVYKFKHRCVCVCVAQSSPFSINVVVWTLFCAVVRALFTLDLHHQQA
jgi:hypothetical protein